MNVVIPVIGSIIATLITALGLYFAAARKLGSEIKVSEAAALRQEAKDLRQEYRDENETLRKRLADLEGRVAKAEENNDELRTENRELREACEGLRATCERLTAELAVAMATNERLQERIDAIEVANGKGETHG